MARMLYQSHRRAEHFKRILCSQEGMSAVVTPTERGVKISLSDGRERLLHREAGITTDTAISVAVHWARRQGATSIRVDDQ